MYNVVVVIVVEINFNSNTTNAVFTASHTAMFFSFFPFTQLREKNFIMLELN